MKDKIDIKDCRNAGLLLWLSDNSCKIFSRKMIKNSCKIGKILLPLFPHKFEKGSEIMSMECVERSFTSGIKKSVHGIVINELWKCWDKVKKLYGTPEDCLSLIKLSVDKINEGVVHVNFIKEEQLFHINTLTGSNCEVVIAFMGNEELLMLKEEAQDMFNVTF